MEQQPCGICGLPFRPQSVLAVALTDDYADMACTGTLACPSCVEYLGRRNPDRFPTPEQLEEGLKRYPEPI
jgi:hypothetical protein